MHSTTSYFLLSSPSASTFAQEGDTDKYICIFSERSFPQQLARDSRILNLAQNVRWLTGFVRELKTAPLAVTAAIFVRIQL